MATSTDTVHNNGKVDEFAFVDAIDGGVGSVTSSSATKSASSSYGSPSTRGRSRSRERERERQIERERADQASDRDRSPRSYRDRERSRSPPPPADAHQYHTNTQSSTSNGDAAASTSSSSTSSSTSSVSSSSTSDDLPDLHPSSLYYPVVQAFREGRSQYSLTDLQSGLKNSRRIYVGGIEHGVPENQLRDIIETKVPSCPNRPPILGPQKSVLASISVKYDKHYAFLETNSPDDGDIVMLFDGISINNIQLRFRRPRDYEVPAGWPVAPIFHYSIPSLNTISTDVRGPNKIYIGNVPVHWSEEMLMTLVGKYGRLRAFTLVRDIHSKQSRGYGFFNYLDEEKDTDLAITALGGMELEGKRLVCHRANPPKDSRANDRERDRERDRRDHRGGGGGPRSFDRSRDADRGAGDDRAANALSRGAGGGGAAASGYAPQSGGGLPFGGGMAAGGGMSGGGAMLNPAAAGMGRGGLPFPFMNPMAAMMAQMNPAAGGGLGMGMGGMGGMGGMAGMGGMGGMGMMGNPAGGNPMAMFNPAMLAANANAAAFPPAAAGGLSHHMLPPNPQSYYPAATAAAAAAASSIPPPSVPASSSGGGYTRSRILALRNLASEQELLHGYDELIEDVSGECGKYGRVHYVCGGGSIVYVEFATVDEADAAANSLRARTFNGQLLNVEWIDEGRWPGIRAASRVPQRFR